MAKNDNLGDFIKGIADAIRAKKGTTNLINPQNFESEIASIQTGSGGSSKLPQILDKTVTELTAEDLANVTRIGSYTFYLCKNLTSIDIPNSVTSIGSYAFQSCFGLTSITIPDSVLTIDSNAFNYCQGLTDVILSNNISEIANNTFDHCYNLLNIYIPNSVTVIGSSAFANCRSLESITIPNSVYEIGKNAFNSCRALASITIPDSVQSIGNGVFYNCTALTSVTMLPTTPPTLGTNVFPAEVTEIIVPFGCGETYKSLTNWSGYADIIVEANEQ